MQRRYPTYTDSLMLSWSGQTAAGPLGRDSDGTRPPGQVRSGTGLCCCGELAPGGDSVPFAVSSTEVLPVSRYSLVGDSILIL